MGFVSVALVPFLKYPATPPAVGNPDTIGVPNRAVLRLHVDLGARGDPRYPDRPTDPADSRRVPGNRHRSRDLSRDRCRCGHGPCQRSTRSAPSPPTPCGTSAVPRYSRLATTWGVTGVILTGLVGKLAKDEQESPGRRFQSGREDCTLRRTDRRIHGPTDSSAIPRRWHPVAGFGHAAQRVEDRMYSDSRARGVLFTAVMVGSVAALGLAAERTTARRPIAHAFAVGLATWPVLGARSLRTEALAVGALVDEGDLAGARKQVTHLVGSRPLPARRRRIGARDRGVGRGEHLRRCRRSTARRCRRRDSWTTCLPCRQHPRCDGWTPQSALRELRMGVPHDSTTLPTSFPRDCRHCSPRGARRWLVAGRPPRSGPGLEMQPGTQARTPAPVEAAFAGGLGIRLGGRNVYGGRVEHRPEMGSGRTPTVDDIGRSVKLADAVAIGALAVSVGGQLRALTHAAAAAGLATVTTITGKFGTPNDHHRDA